jgi:hypothetical protein
LVSHDPDERNKLNAHCTTQLPFYPQERNQWFQYNKVDR